MKIDRIFDIWLNESLTSILPFRFYPLNRNSINFSFTYEERRKNLFSQNFERIFTQNCRQTEEHWINFIKSCFLSKAGTGVTVSWVLTFRGYEIPRGDCSHWSVDRLTYIVITTSRLFRDLARSWRQLPNEVGTRLVEVALTKAKASLLEVALTGGVEEDLLRVALTQA